jgi:hypothetical protein
MKGEWKRIKMSLKDCPSDFEKGPNGAGIAVSGFAPNNPIGTIDNSLSLDYIGCGRGREGSGFAGGVDAAGSGFIPEE